MPELADHIKRLNIKLQQLLKQYRLLQAENEKLITEVNSQKLIVQQCQQQNEQLNQQVMILKTSSGKMDEPDKKAFEKKINQYIKEIDKCIGLLSE